MSTTTQAYLPTTEALKASLPADVDAEKVAREWLDSFANAVSSNNVDAILSHIHPDGWWRDAFALTWDLRTFQGADKLKQFIQDRVISAKISGVKLEFARVDSPFEDVSWITLQFDFETDIIGGKGLVRLVPTPNGEWKAFLLFTNLENLKGFPEKTGPNRNFEPNHGKWRDQRNREKEFADGDPEVIVVGGGQSGLDVAARLKHIGVSNLVIEKQGRIGDQWRNRYAALCLHDPVCKSLLMSHCFLLYMLNGIF